MASKKIQTEIEIGGIKFTGGKMFAVAAALSAAIGTLYAGFEVYKDYQDMKQQIQNYVAPDLSEINKKIAVIEENSNKAVDYTRDIKNDLKQDIRKLEIVVENVERSVKQSQRETDQDIRTLRKEIDQKIQKAIDNPLAGK